MNRRHFLINQRLSLLVPVLRIVLITTWIAMMVGIHKFKQYEPEMMVKSVSHMASTQAR